MFYIDCLLTAFRECLYPRDVLTILLEYILYSGRSHPALVPCERFVSAVYTN
jgi:hypothetical protein